MSRIYAVSGRQITYVIQFLFSLNAVLPLFFCCLTGYGARRFGWITDAVVSACSRVVFYRHPGQHLPEHLRQ